MAHVFHFENLLCMMLQFVQPVQPAKISTRRKSDLQPSPFKPFFKILVGIALLALFLMAVKPFIEFDGNGKPRLASWRQKKLEKHLTELEGAEQYVLRAGINGLYPCYSCPDSIRIWLYFGEIWKYGITTKSEKGRYGRKLKGSLLNYEIQFQGSLEDCLKEERRKIFAYALLPENLKRQKPLIRPPGNKKDS